MHARKLLVYLALATAALLVTAGAAPALEVGINLDVHQDLNLPTAQLPNDFHLAGRIESGPPGGNWGQPPVLIDHVDDIFLGGTFTCQITPDLNDPAQNWFKVEAHWQRAAGIPFCTIFHLGLLFDVACHNVIIDVTGYWTRNGQPIAGGTNGGFWPTLGFRVDRTIPPVAPGGQFIRIQNGNANGMIQPGEIETHVVGMDLVAVPSREELEFLLGTQPFRELRTGGLQESLPWLPVFNGAMPISESNFIPVIDSFFDVFLDATGFIHPAAPIEVQPGGFLLARERVRFINNFGQTEYRWIWEIHEAHKADLGDAPDSTNTMGPAMTAYPLGGPPGVVAHYPTVFMAGSPPHGPVHWNPRARAFLGPNVTFEDEADIGPDQDLINNILPLADMPNRDMADDAVGIPLMLNSCQPTTFNYTVNIVVPALAPLYVNVWFDWNRDGDFDDTLMCPDGAAAPEWAVQNHLLPALPLGLNSLMTPVFTPWHPVNGANNPIWMRITLAEQQAPVAVGFGYGGAGPAGGYLHGETEDYYFAPIIVIPPVITQQPVGGAFCEGDDVLLHVEATGTLPLHYQWLHNGSPVGGDSPDLLLDSVDMSDAGNYVVTVSNNAGSDTSNPANLYVWERGTGDADGNGLTNGQDIRLLIEALLGSGHSYAECVCDMDGQNGLTIDDVPDFVEVLLGA